MRCCSTLHRKQTKLMWIWNRYIFNIKMKWKKQLNTVKSRGCAAPLHPRTLRQWLKVKPKRSKMSDACVSSWQFKIKNFCFEWFIPWEYLTPRKWVYASVCADANPASFFTSYVDVFGVMVFQAFTLTPSYFLYALTSLVFTLVIMKIKQKK